MVPHRLKLSVDIYSQNMKQQTMPFFYQGQLKAIAIVDRTSIFGRPKHAPQFQVGIRDYSSPKLVPSPKF